VRFRFEGLELDTERLVLHGPAGEIALSEPSLRILASLVERAPATVSTEALMRAGWPEQPVGKSTVRQTVAAIRDALGDEGPDFRLIANRHGLGYQFIGPLTGPAHQGKSIKRLGTRPLPIAIAVVVAVLALLLGVPQFTATDPPDSDSVPNAQHYRQAQDLVERREFEAALDYLGEHSADAEGRGQLALPLAQALAARGKYPAARDMLASVASRVGQWPRQQRLEWEALSARLDFEFDRAVERYQALNQYYPDSRISRAWAEALIDARRLDEAEQALEAVEQTYPDDPRNALLAARLADAADDQDRRLSAARRAEALAERQDLPALSRRALIVTADAEIRLGRSEAARATLDRLDSQIGVGPRLQADQGLSRAEMHFREGSYPESLAALDAAQALYESLGADDGVARALIVRGNIQEMSGQAEPAMANIARAIDRLDRVGDPRQLARAHVNLGISQMRAGRIEAALDNFEHAQGYFRRIGDARGEAIAMLNTGTLLARVGRQQEAEPAFGRALVAFETAADERGQAIALSNLAGLASAGRDSERSIELNRRALTIFEAIQSRPDIARVALNLGVAYRRRGELETAEDLMRQAAEAFDELGIVPSHARSLINLGRLMLDRGRADETRQILAMLRGLELDRPTERSAIDRLDSDLARRDGRLEQAERLLETARDRLADDPDSPYRLLAELDLAGLRLAQGDTITAEGEARRLADRFAALDYPGERVQALMVFVEALLAQGRSDEADNWLRQAESLLADAPDAKQVLELELLRSRLEPDDRRRRLEAARASAARQGFAVLEANAEARIASLER
jgi:tetratricopeptide (TPR) repeat protein